MKISFLGLLVTLLILSCTKENTIIKSYPSIHIVPDKSVTLDTTQLKTWAYKDIMLDTIPGISLDRVYTDVISDKTGDTIIIALLDTELDITHEDLKDQIWVNSDEIESNGIDDDDNGYIDDIHGWNFLGNKSGGNVLFQNFEITRIVKYYEEILKKGKSISLEEEKKYLRAKKLYDHQSKNAELDLEYVHKVVKKYRVAKEELSMFFPDKKYTTEKLALLKSDSLHKKLFHHIESLQEMLRYNITEKEMDDQIRSYANHVDYYLNKEYDDRMVQQDDPFSILDISYGNNIVNNNLGQLYHGTLVSGILAAKRSNTIGIDGITNKAIIMPLCISVNGDEHDKDIALAIRYAVDNGAKIINMSSSKHFSLHQEWVTEALEYANKKDVLFIMSAGNNNKNLDLTKNRIHPSPSTRNGQSLDNFILVGGSGKKADAYLKASFSNYGKNTVDIFAPSIDMYTTNINNNYKKDSGTSFAAPIVSGVAALIRSYYPSLSAAAVKDILMQSGTAYHINVEIEQEDGTKKLVPFSELSKSGRIVNAYNALLLAEKISKQ